MELLTCTSAGISLRRYVSREHGNPIRIRFLSAKWVSAGGALVRGGRGQLNGEADPAVAVSSRVGNYVAGQIISGALNQLLNGHHDRSIEYSPGRMRCSDSV